MKMKRTWVMAAALLLSLCMALSGTMAYLADTDSDVNVMTLGNVYIEQHENQLGDDGVTIEPFEQNKPFYPGTELSKIVTVENTGKSEAYFRTLIAFEDIDSDTFEIDFPISEQGYVWSWGAPEATIVVDGTTFVVYEALYTQPLTPGETSPVSLSKVVMSAAATNEDMEKLGGTYEILVLSQAVQTEGFADARTALDTAFGDVTDETAAEWFGGMLPVTYVNDSEELTEAMKNGEANIVYAGTEPVVLDETLTVSGEMDIDLNGAELVITGDTGIQIGDDENEGELTLTNAVIDGADNMLGAFAVGEGGTLTLGEGVKVTNCDDTLIRVYGDTLTADGKVGKLVLSGVEISGNTVAAELIIVGEKGELVIEEGTVIANNTVEGNYYLMDITGTVIMNGGEITNNTFGARSMIHLERDGKFVMNDGEISGNVGTKTGSKYLIDMFGSGTHAFLMNGGTIDVAGDGLTGVSSGSTVTLNGTVIK